MLLQEYNNTTEYNIVAELILFYDAPKTEMISVNIVGEYISKFYQDMLTRKNG